VKADRGLTIERMVELGGVSRSGFYRFDKGGPPRPDGDMELRDAIHRIALEWPSYGRPRITAELRRQGWTVNHKRVRRLLRKDNLLCLRKRKFVVTTDSNHGRKVYPNLAGKMTLTGVDQLWVADITYVRLQEEFVFLAVILDAYSRRVIGWALDQTMEDDPDAGGVTHGAGQPEHRARAGAPFRPWLAIREHGLHRFAERPRHRYQYESERKSLGQRGVRIVHENVEVRGGVPQ
jgi:transposase InsO family protein